MSSSLLETKIIHHLTHIIESFALGLCGWVLSAADTLHALYQYKKTVPDQCCEQ